MNIDKILEYQKQDFEIIKLERQLDNNEDKKIYQSMVGVVKDAQNRSTSLNKEAKTLLEEYKSLEKVYNDNIKSCGIVINKKLDNVSEEDLENVSDAANDIINNINILEKRLMYLAERVNAILSDFDATKKKYNEAKLKYTAHKEAYEKKSEELAPRIEKLKQDIKSLEKDLDATCLAKYKQRRDDKIYPVFVPMLDKTCGGCRMEIPSASLEKLKNQGFLECEHCRRIIYNK